MCGGYNHSGQTGRRGKEQQLRILKQLSPELFGCPAGANARWLDIACGVSILRLWSQMDHYSHGKKRFIFWCILPGANEFGQLGDDTEEGRKHPKKVKQLQTEFVKFVSCGAHCTAAIAEPRENDGTISTSRIWIWGQNQGSNLPRLFWGAFTPSMVLSSVLDVFNPGDVAVIVAFFYPFFLLMVP
ncbi:hypothetical protein CRYUN_Cryun01aG0109300 [Craigia yunnanensis]